MKRILSAAVLLLCSAGIIFSFDFGLLADQRAEAENELFTYSSALTPWFSYNGGQGLTVYLSGLLSMDYKKYTDENSGDGWNNPVVLPELSRFAIGYRAGRNLFVEAGRVGYTDTTGLAAAGLFDGFRLEADLPAGSMSAGLFYTGLLYKKTAEIIMTADDVNNYAQPWDWDTYGASRRLLTALRWNIPLAEYHALSFEALAQFDLNGSEETLHSQYTEIQAEFYPQSRLGIILGALFETMQNSDGGFSAAFGAAGRLKTDLPGTLNHGLNVTVKYTSGNWNDTFAAFTPINSRTQGLIFPGSISALALLRADYEARILSTLAAEGTMCYFFRTFEDPGESGSVYGGELWASLAYQPFDDVRITLGGGAFFPGLGNIYPDDTDTMWKVRAGLAISF
ncbi:MAG: hypothetical protein FWG99_03340 [Treponema sp.]|nr:hypothetical protein [Treponema sp.]